MSNRSKNIAFTLNLALMLFLYINIAQAARIKDIANIEGVSGTQVIGYGLVTGLNQTGDNQLTSFTVQSVSNMLKRFGLTIPNSNPRMRNVAAVMITATVPPFAKKGYKVDVTVSSIGDATSLQGGILVMSPMSLADGSIIGMAQGALSVGGYDYRALGSMVSKNTVTSGRIPNGLIMESEMKGQFVQNQLMRINLHDPDFTTANNIAIAVNALAGLTNAATPIDAATVQVQLPAGQNQSQIMQTIANIEAAQVQSDPAARIVINERTGTVVVGGNVQLLPVVIAHGGLEISIQREVVFPYPPAVQTVIPINSSVNMGSQQGANVASITVGEETNPATPLVIQGATVQDIASALNLLQVKPRDLISIFQALKESGSLQGELIIQ
jgi:flagellar P-ring protein precursor FlgI